MELETEVNLFTKLKTLVTSPLGLITGLFGTGALTVRAIIILSTVGLLTSIYVKGRVDANLSCAKNAALGVSKSVKEYGAITKKTNGMDERQLDSYLSKWMRD